MCEACLADDLLVARALDSSAVFFVCAACCIVTSKPPTSNESCLDQDRNEVLARMAPHGWELMTVTEAQTANVPDSSTRTDPELYQELIKWLPGFRMRHLTER